MSSTTTQKAIIYGPDNQPLLLQPNNNNARRPPRHGGGGGDHVLIAVYAVGLNPVDAKGVIGDKLPHHWTTWQALAARCFVRNRVIGFDFAGVVVKEESSSSSSSSSSSTSSTASRTFHKGDRVYGIVPPSQRHGGTLQEYIRVSTNQIAHIPPRVTMAQAAALPLVGLTALQCLQGAGWGDFDSANNKNDSNNRDGNATLLVIGASGGTGHVAVQIGRALQPTAKIVAVCSALNRPFVQSLADNVVVLDYRDENFVQQLTAEGPYDVVMDCVTSGDPRDQANMDYGQLLWQQQDNNGGTPFLKPNAQYRRLGGVFGDWVKAGVERTTSLSLWSNPRSKLFWIQMHEAAPALQQMATWLENGTLRVGAHVAQTVPFTPEGVQQGFDALLGRRVVGKVVVEVLPEEAGQVASRPSDQEKKDL